MADDDMKAELDRLRNENERLKQRGSRATSLKVSEKGGVSVYGLGRFPVTLYKEQWTKLLDMADENPRLHQGQRVEAQDEGRRVAGIRRAAAAVIRLRRSLRNPRSS